MNAPVPTSPFRRPQWSWWQRLLVGMVIASLTAYGVWQVFPWFPIYETSALMQIAYVQPRLLPERPNIVRDQQPPYEWYLGSQAQLVKSDLVQKKAISRPGISNLLDQQGAIEPHAWLETHLKVAALPNTTMVEVSLWSLKPDGLHDIVNAMVTAYYDEIVNVERNRSVHRLTELERILMEKEEGLRAKRTTLKKIAVIIGDEAKNSCELLDKQREIEHLQAIRDRLETEIEDTKVELNAPARISLLQDAEPALPAAPKRRLPLALGVGTATLLLSLIFLPRKPRRAA